MKGYEKGVKTIEQSLGMNLSQHLAMTMQLQQAIEILQLSAQDLCATIEKEYLENPVLEMDYPSGRRELYESDGPAHAGVRALADYLDGGSKQPAYFTDEDERQFDAPAPLHATLEEELLEQVNFTFKGEHGAEKERAVATFLVGSLDSRGYLTLPVAEVARAMACSEAEVLRVLAVIQGFEPAGVGARDLAECLRLQAQRQGIYDGLVAAIIDRHLDAVAAHRLKEIAAAEHVRPAEVQMAAEALIAAGVKAVFTPTDNTVMTAELSIYETFLDAGVQHYTGADSFALNGAFVGYGVDYVQLGEATADMVVQLLCEGKTTADLPYQTFDNGIATINTETCKALGLDLDTVKKAFEPYCTEVVEVTTQENF